MTQAFDVPQTEPELEAGALTRAFEVPQTELEAPEPTRTFISPPEPESLEEEPDLELELEAPAVTQAFPQRKMKPIPPPPVPSEDTSTPTFLDLPSGEPAAEPVQESVPVESPPTKPPSERPAHTTVVPDPSPSLQNFPAVNPRFTRAFGSLEESVEEAPRISKEDALETLRMQYIAGEMSRDEYYERKKSLEESSESNLSAPSLRDSGIRKKRPLAKGRRIELNLEKD